MSKLIRTLLVTFSIFALLKIVFIQQAFALDDAYRVQVGDVLRLSLPGEESLDKTFDVNSQGKIYLPEVGALKVSELLESELEQTTREALSAAFQDLENLRVYVLERRILVTVLGYVEAPGEVLSRAGANVQSIIAQAGGLRAGAQLDRMQLRRNGQSQVFNYKAYLDSGDNDMLPKLRSLDTIFVPASPKTGNIEAEFDPSKVADSGDASNAEDAIKVFGEVNSPGSFAYRPGIGVLDLLMRAGGVTRYAGVERIRIISREEPTLFDLKHYLDTGNAAALPEIAPGTTLFVPKQEEAVKSNASTVYVMGEVFHPGAYESSDGVSFLDILANAGGPTRYAESRQIRVLKIDGTVERFDLTSFTEGSSTAALPRITPGDAIFVPEKTDMNEKSWLKVAPDRAVRVIGEVVRPGRVEWSSEMNLLDLLAHVGGPVSRADTSNIEVLRQLPDGSTQAELFNLDEFIKQGKSDSELPKIYAGSTIRVHDLPQDPSDNKAQWVRQSSDKSIYIFGQVGAPGRYMFTDEMNFLDILAAADGPTMDADIHNIRITHRDKRYAEVSELNLSLYFETGDESLLPKVKTGDSIYIPEKNREWTDKAKEKTVRVMGEVNKPGRYSFNDSMTILDILAEAGGPTGEAHVKKILVVNLSCCKNEARSFNLLKFGKTGDFSKLPILRVGDTIYVPNREDSTGHKARTIIGDTFRIVSLAVLLGL
ncbi:SLBB domain-containing protein [Agaribacterium haliotis]|uniref:SLBB domain-containing protein n=1 Tax=Agaribacterium haliotis TaxID=2013869 RepID=UPI000BB57617|nr:SLBB domain-containing protein [Agaribacterium haliotis]